MASWIRLAAGMRFGRLTVVEKTAEKDKQGRCYLWCCRCDCGNVVHVSSTMLRNKQVQSCGCLQKETREHDVTGLRFGRLVALEPTGDVRGHSRVWRCLCDCGNIVEVRARHLVSGDVQSCGCLQRETKAAQAVAMQAGCGRVEGTSLSNIASTTLYKNNSSGVRGVSWHAGTNMFVARIGFKGVMYTLGYRHSVEEAAALRREAEEKLYAPMLEKHKRAP